MEANQEESLSEERLKLIEEPNVDELIHEVQARYQNYHPEHHIILGSEVDLSPPDILQQKRKGEKDYEAARDYEGYRTF